MGRKEFTLTVLIVGVFAVALLLRERGDQNSTSVAPKADRAGRSIQEAETETVPPNVIQGIARTMSGEPVSGVWILCQGVGVKPGCTKVLRSIEGEETCLRRGDRTRSDGSFRIDGVPDGRYELWPYGTEKDKVTVDAGTGGVALVVAAAKPLRLRLRGWRPADLGAVALLRLAHNYDPPEVVVSTGPFLRIGEDGHAASHPLDSSEPYQVWIGGLADGRYAWHEGARPSDDVIELVVKSGGTIQGRVQSGSERPLDQWYALAFGPVPALRPELGDVDKFPITQSDAEGTFVVRGVPPGRWRILVRGTVHGAKVEETVWASPGDNVTVTLGGD